MGTRPDGPDGPDDPDGPDGPDGPGAVTDLADPTDLTDLTDPTDPTHQKDMAISNAKLGMCICAVSNPPVSASQVLALVISRARSLVPATPSNVHEQCDMLTLPLSTLIMT